MDNDIQTYSVFGGIVAVVLAVIHLFSDWRRNRSDEKIELKRIIDEKQAALYKMLEEGLITDAARLQKEICILMEQYRKSRRSEDAKPKVRPVVMTAIAVAMSVACIGCASAQKKPETVVIGERIFILEPGAEIKVPELLPPAKCWYLTDNVGLAGWLGITAPTGERHVH